MFPNTRNIIDTPIETITTNTQVPTHVQSKPNQITTTKATRSDNKHTNYNHKYTTLIIQSNINKY